MTLYKDGGGPSGRQFERGVSGDDLFIGKDTALGIAKGKRVTSETQLLAFVDTCFMAARQSFGDEEKAQWRARWKDWEEFREAFQQRASPSPGDDDQEGASGQEAPRRTVLTVDRQGVSLRFPMTIRLPIPGKAARRAHILWIAAFVLAVVTGVITLPGLGDDGDGSQGKSGATPGPSATSTAPESSSLRGPDPTGSRPPATDDELLHLSRTSGPQRTMVTLDASGFTAHEQVRFEIFEGGCNVPFPKDDRPVLRDVSADSDGAVKASLRLYTDVDCAGGSVEVRATGRDSKTTRSADFTFN
ncbi:hypothetical protein ACIHIX_39615 [Streptomyces sp. NPDC051913]|uniref:hypothetical protein n=1 Tax=Streptomyces sp. NPDC051913 TaxID=3365676 RepID=UPI0037D429D1